VRRANENEMHIIRLHVADLEKSAAKTFPGSHLVPIGSHRRQTAIAGPEEILGAHVLNMAITSPRRHLGVVSRTPRTVLSEVLMNRRSTFSGTGSFAVASTGSYVTS